MTEVMKIMIVGDRYPPEPGGVAISTRRLTQALRQAGHAVQVSVLSDQVLPGSIQLADDDGLPPLPRGYVEFAPDGGPGKF